MGLADYNRKRDFKKTAEPRGVVAKKGKRLRYVIQKHAASHLHYDFRLEMEGVLKSWAVPKGPSFDTSQKRLAMQVEDHPLAYGTFEGTIPKGEYGGGTVMLWDEGEWVPDSDDPVKDLKTGSIKFELKGEKLKGRWTLFRMKRAGDNAWLLVKERDGFAKKISAGDILEDAPNSVKSGLSLEEIPSGKKVSRSPAPKKSAAKSKLVKPAPAKKSVAPAVVSKLTITHPEKIYYAEKKIRKRDLALYFLKVADRMLEHISGRPLMIVRCPEGAGAACFYQKHWTAGFPAAIRKIKVKGEKELFLSVDSAEGLVALAQFGVLEVHVWNTHFEHLETPDQFVFDIDPDAEVPWKKVAQTALLIRDELKKVGLKSFVKTTGGKGLHVVAPVKPGLKWNLGLQFTKALCDDIARRNPALYLTNMSKARRKGKIYLDYLRNGRGATAVAPYSPRAREGAGVSMPLAWKNIETGVKNAAFDIVSVTKKLPVDAWKGFYKIHQFPRGS